MSVLIKGMEMPETCEDCEFHRYHSHNEYVCIATPLFYPMNLANTKGIRKDFCPLVELPEKHGRLIDAEALIDTLEQAIAIMETMLKQLDLEADDGCLMELKAYRDIRDGIKEIDAVIEAEGE